MNFDSPSLLCATLPPSAAGERERFEEWAKDEGYYVFNDPINDDHPIYYTEENVRCMWQAWQAARSRGEGVTEEELANRLMRELNCHYTYAIQAARVAMRVMRGEK
jgi:hypothetical protein